MRTTLSMLLCLVAAPVAIRAQTSTRNLVEPTVVAGASWRRDTSSRDGSIVLRRGVDTAIVIRVGHGEGSLAHEWFRRGVRKASSTGAILLRDPVKRKIGGRDWHEARFRGAARDRTATVTTVQSATSYGPCVLEAYLRGPTRTIDRLLPEFDRVRQRLRGGALESSSLTRVARGDLEGLWRLCAGTAKSGRESYRFTSEGSLVHRDNARTTQLSYALSGAGILTTSALGSLKRDSHSCFRVTLPLRAAKLQSGDLVIVRHTPAGRPIDVRVLRDAD